jgi:hypothetical protein
MNNGRQWFEKNFKDDGNKIYTSKFYTAEETWPKIQVWWLQFCENTYLRKRKTIDLSLFFSAISQVFSMIDPIILVSSLTNKANLLSNPGE